MIARGKREAQRNASPLVRRNNLKRALKVRNINVNYSALSELHGHCALTRGDAPHVVRRLPLAFIFRAFGAGVRPNLNLTQPICYCLPVGEGGAGWFVHGAAAAAGEQATDDRVVQPDKTSADRTLPFLILRL